MTDIVQLLPDNQLDSEKAARDVVTAASHTYIHDFTGECVYVCVLCGAFKLQPGLSPGILYDIFIVFKKTIVGSGGSLTGHCVLHL